MNILITGANGQLGWDVCQCFLQNSSHNLLTPNSKELDLFSEESIKNYTKKHSFDAVIHLAAYTMVDKAESEKDICFRTNTDGTLTLLNEAKKKNAKFLFISTDYVFDGTGTEPYKTFFKKNPLNNYGLSKSLAEDGIVREYYNKSFIVRTSTVIGKHGNNFIKTMLNIAKSKTEVNEVCDQISSPTFTFDLAPLLLKIIQSDEYGFYHACNEGAVSKSDLTRQVYKILGIGVKVCDVKTEDYYTPAKRPLYSVLNTQTLKARGFGLLPPWQESLKLYLG